MVETTGRDHCDRNHWKKGYAGLQEMTECRVCTPRCVICDTLGRDPRTSGVVCEVCYKLDAERRGRNGEPDRRVIEAVIVRYFNRGIKPEDVKWDAFGGNWYFYLSGMYVGVEPDGYAHT
jgi:hypothetical protein